jgi:hypothetical protein
VRSTGGRDEATLDAVSRIADRDRGKWFSLYAVLAGAAIERREFARAAELLEVARYADDRDVTVRNLFGTLKALERPEVTDEFTRVAMSRSEQLAFAANRRVWSTPYVRRAADAWADILEATVDAEEVPDGWPPELWLYVLAQTVASRSGEAMTVIALASPDCPAALPARRMPAQALRERLDAAAKAVGLIWEVRGAVVYLSREPLGMPRTVVYRLHDSGAAVDALVLCGAVLRESAPRSCWESDPETSFAVRDGLLTVHHLAFVHERIRKFLEEVRRAAPSPDDSPESAVNSLVAKYRRR